MRRCALGPGGGFGWTGGRLRETVRVVANFIIIETPSPLLLSFPHVGTALPGEVEERLTAAGRARHDTDWHLERLYDFAWEWGVGQLRAVWSRYLIDLNRAPDDRELYPGMVSTGLVPTVDFRGQRIVPAGEEPGEGERQRRREQYWEPYHRALSDWIRARRGEWERVVVLECHSIAPELPRLFEGRLPDFSLGTYGGRSCAPELRDRLAEVLASSGRSHVVDGHFQGGYLTQHYGAPGDGVHVFQVEQALSTYADEAWPYAYRPERAEQVRPLLRELVRAALEWARGGGR